jgi:hypothetical protein
VRCPASLSFLHFSSFLTPLSPLLYAHNRIHLTDTYLPTTHRVHNFPFSHTPPLTGITGSCSEVVVVVRPCWLLHNTAPRIAAHATSQPAAIEQRRSKSEETQERDGAKANNYRLGDRAFRNIHQTMISSAHNPLTSPSHRERSNRKKICRNPSFPTPPRNRQRDDIASHPHKKIIEWCYEA